MNWTQLKNSIYNWDGSWRDIYVKNTTSKDWEKWVQFVNSNFEIKWHNANLKRDEPKIDFNVIQEYWRGNTELISTAQIFLDKIQINSHFFGNDEIENDLDPREFRSMEDHQKLIKYLKGVSKHLGKPVFLTPENNIDIILIEVNGDKVILNTINE